MPLDYQSEDGTTSSRNGIPNGALTVLIIAAIAIVCVVITLFCMLVNNRRNARTRQRTQQRQGQTVLRLSPASALSSPTGDTVRPASFPPMYIVSPSYDPKFDAPPSYEDAVRTMVQNGEPGLPNQTVITIPEHSQSTSSSSSLESGAARIDVEMTQHHHVPTTSGLTV
ncbi:uncharacterized protein CELE_C54E4.4 [Caenorhabditis elegans]|uniref:Uncharacterized protein n=1 Tax=Caenorhabditis elegans TaxID=6239 RepID=O44469_CAEEL|nr:Uncharacterized protein CELE_C54E4.4 [Caenorhabditis elegans]CCD68038.1 Uncharacterized protein CELE_C54E4.4 [Caenorhabditis elegans]|eukprot:NP_500172.1 Uncharacterized protein CELE_C54E4.4 [Caenorhabditis elegans]